MKVLYDSNVLIKYLAGDDKARTLVEKVINGEWEGFITGIVVSETIYIYLRLALDVPRYKLRELIIKQDERINNLLEEDIRPLLSFFNLITTETNIEELLDIIESYGLLPNDALIAVAALKHGISTISTFDEDFRRVPWLRVIP
ncbi:type II toxin-antitoxin system VapC family toxin [Aeropyrum camini]|uniref:Predicted nucleic acid-binding protein n=1 Tax=Aeropyrum camini SY1 = JCM 12091 TaxID=1198449 RepID=U3TGG6_9CREN|nr:type II toxin-antitoxin system VapC family toxin [Aeropyrum camini]BAN91110.1 predicted nucleic acid-binding protein [Aeropyrum camini SY1 = JCM 12091]